jgi:hypothetical protein
MRVDLVEWLPGVRIEQCDGCSEDALLVPSGGRVTVNAVSQISEMAHQLRRILGGAVHIPFPFYP